MRKYHVYGIGNALVDSDIQVDDAFLQAHQVEKKVMTLTDEATHQRLLHAVAGYPCHSCCGGSAANTMIAISQFGGRGYYSCKVADDDAGLLFLRELNALNLDCNLSLESLSPGVTGQCLVLVTEDAQRSMNTHLGITETLDPTVLDLDAIAAAEYVYLEGYLVTSPTARKALITARQRAKETKTKVAMTLSDINMVRYFKAELLTIIDDRVDLLFCNEEEALLFTGAEYLEKAIALLQPLANHLVVTCGSKGAVLASDGDHIAIPTKAIPAIDTVGAGDMFAGAYLYAITHGYAPQQAVELANKAAGEVVSQYGARLSEQRVLAIKEEFIASNYSFAKRVYSQAVKEVEAERVETLT